MLVVYSILVEAHRRNAPGKVGARWRGRATFWCSLSGMATLETIVQADPEIRGGTPVFRGTRVPIKNLLDYRSPDDRCAFCSMSHDRDPSLACCQSAMSARSRRWAGAASSSVRFRV